MEMSKLKVLIYTLTFLSYAWSSYGFSLLPNLGISKGSEAAVDDSCVYTCPEGGKPVKNNNYTPSSNGCGPFGLQIPTGGIPVKEMIKTCCDQHDVCYGTCNSRKETCDKEFAQCLDKICKKLKKRLGDKPADVCMKAMKTAVTAVYGLGCSFYFGGQKNACYCP